MDAYERYSIKLELIKDDNTAISLLEKLIESAVNYISSVIKMEHSYKKFLEYQTEELKEESSHLDKQRTIAHNDLISSLQAFNRYIIKNYQEDVPVGGIFSKDPHAIHNRRAVGDWAMELISSIYARRK